MPTIADKRRAFRKLHETGCFVIPNPWDIGSARYLQHLGFKALATTSAGFAFTRALPDGGVPRDMMLAHIREIVEATKVLSFRLARRRTFDPQPTLGTLAGAWDQAMSELGRIL